MWIDRVEPTDGWPGSVLTIRGGGFGSGLDDNRVTVGGDAALVLRANPDELRVLVGEHSAGGPIEVETAGVVALAPVEFEIRPTPDERTVAEAGPPEFFHGPQHGTPALRVPNQRVLSILTYASNTPRPSAADRNSEGASFDNAERFWREASFGRTTFDIITTDWLRLPRQRNEYVWDELDVGWARSNLLNSTKRWTEVVGNRAYSAHLAVGLAVLDVADPDRPRVPGQVSPGWLAYHVVVRGNRAYVAADTAGIAVLDVSNPSAPTVIRTVGGIGRIRGLDLDPGGTFLVAAAREDGLRVFSLSDPSNPVLRSTVAITGMNWVSCVRVVGTRVFAGMGNEIRVYDVTNLGVPNLIDSHDVQAWVLGVDADASTCAVATDGHGLAVFTVDAAGNITPAAQDLTVRRLHGVRLAGKAAACAAADRGIRIVDLTNPAAPAELSVIALGRACYDVAPAGNRAYLGLGARSLAPVDLTDLRRPVVGSEVQLNATPPFGMDANLAAMRTDLANVTNNHGKLKSERLYVDAYRAAAAAGADLDSPVGIIVVIAGSPGRAQSGLSTKVGVPGDEWTFRDTKGVIWLPGNAHWGRRSHEIGHWFDMPDIYTEWYDDGRILQGTAGPWDMAGEHDRGPLFSGHQAIGMQLFDPANVVRRRWDPAAGPSSEPFDILAHDLHEDAGGRVHLVELVVADGLSYFIEVRQQPGSVIFDATLPEVRVDQGLVIVTRCTEGRSISNTFERPTMLFGVAGVGESIVDAARLLRIEVESQLSTRPLAFRVRVHWNDEPPPDPDGKFDLRITPWSTDTWETPDIWVNSMLNDQGGIRYEYCEPGDPTKPILNGDKPWVQWDNTIYARIRNSGVQTVNDVYVTAYITTPPGIGDNGQWRTLASQQVSAMAANSDQIVEFIWNPESNAHTCISVAVMPKAGEIEPRNNRAQENVAKFDSPGGSSHEAVILEAMVRSPFSEWRKVDLETRDLPEGWHAVIDRAWVWVPPKGEVPVTAIIWTEYGSPGNDRDDLPREAQPRIEGWTDFDHRYLPIGGILAPIRANARTEIRTDITAGERTIYAYAALDPPNFGVAGVLIVTDAVGARRLVELGLSDPAGRFSAEVPVDPGRYTVQVFSASTPEAAEAESEARDVEVV